MKARSYCSGKTWVTVKSIIVALAVNSEATQKIVGIRPGEKMHEQMIGMEDAPFTYEYKEHFKILPSINNWSSDPARINDGKLVDPSFIYTSDLNLEWMSIEELQSWMSLNAESLEQA